MWQIKSVFISVFQFIRAKFFGDGNSTDNKTSRENDKHSLNKSTNELESSNKCDKHLELEQAVKNCMNEEVRNVRDKQLGNQKIMNEISEGQSVIKNDTTKISDDQSCDDIKNIIKKNVHSLELEDWDKLYAETMKYIDTDSEITVPTNEVALV